MTARNVARKRKVVALFDNLEVAGPDDVFDQVPYGYKYLFAHSTTQSHIIVGNGPVEGDYAKAVDGFDVVIGCNAWRQFAGPSSYPTGTKCNVILLNAKS